VNADIHLSPRQRAWAIITKLRDANDEEFAANADVWVAQLALSLQDTNAELCALERSRPVLRRNGKVMMISDPTGDYVKRSDVLAATEVPPLSEPRSFQLSSPQSETL